MTRARAHRAFVGDPMIKCQLRNGHVIDVLRPIVTNRFRADDRLPLIERGVVTAGVERVFQAEKQMGRRIGNEPG